MRRPVLIGGMLLLLAALCAALAHGLLRPARAPTPTPAAASRPKPVPPPAIVPAPLPPPRPVSPAVVSSPRAISHPSAAHAPAATRPAPPAVPRHHATVHRHAPAPAVAGSAPHPFLRHATPVVPRAPPVLPAAPDAIPPLLSPAGGDALSTSPPAASPAPDAVSPATIAAVPVETPAAAEQVVTLSAGSARVIRLPRPMAGVFVADADVADVKVAGRDAMYLFAKKAGLTSISATDAAGQVLWSRDVRVGVNLADAAGVLRTAMPEAEIAATPIAGVLLLTGTVASPAEAEAAQRLAEQVTAGSVPVVNRLQVAAPQQVNLQVKIAEVNRSVARAIGLNYRTGTPDGSFKFGLAQGRDGAISSDLNTITTAGSGTTLLLGGKLLGLDIRQAIDLAETNGLVTTLAEPNLTVLSGETASFLAGGEIPIPQSQGLGSVSVEFKQYGVSLAFTPTVMSGGRIALRVRPEVSQLTDVGSVKVNGFTIPALTTRRAETTVELGSGQSFAIGGLLQNTHNNSVDKAPVLGDLPIIGSLFRSNSFQKNETELVIVVTPYLVKPVDANRLALPTDGYRAASTVGRVLLGHEAEGTTGQTRPVPQAAPAPAPNTTTPVPVPAPDAPR